MKRSRVPAEEMMMSLEMGGKSLLRRVLPSVVEVVWLVGSAGLLYKSGSFRNWMIVIGVTATIPGRLHVAASLAARMLTRSFFGVVLIAELFVYVLVRLLIIAAEYCVADFKPLRKALAKADSYRDWYHKARLLDQLEGRDAWQKSPPHNDDKHNWGVIEELMLDMRIAREMDDPIAALAVLQQATQRNVGGIMSADLFSHTNTGEPKQLVLDFVKEVEITTDWLVDGVVGPEPEQKRKNSGSSGTDKKSSKLKRFMQRQKKQSGDTASIASGFSRSDYADRLNDYQSVMLQQMRDWSGGNSVYGGGSSYEDDDVSLQSYDYSIMSYETKVSEAPKRRTSLRSRISDEHTYHDGLSVGETLLGNPGANASHSDQVQNFIRRARASYGRTALCLSGGSSNAMSHVGVIKALYEGQIIPPIIAGTSAGSYLAAFVGTRTDEEIKRDLNPELLHKHAKFECVVWHNSWADKIEKFLTVGAPCYLPRQLFDTLEWFCCGDLTFEEAYKKTGRVLNITATPTTKSASPALLNYLSAPNVTVSSAVMCSCNLPGLLLPRPLYIKTEDGYVVPQQGGVAGQNYTDGSCRMDIPTRSLGELFNCTHFITAQANPYAVPFHFESTGSVGRPNLWEPVQGSAWVEVFRGGFVLSSLEIFLKSMMFQQHGFLAHVASSASIRDGENERHESDVLIVARQRVINYVRLLNDPTLDQWHHFIRNGATATYEAMAMLKLHKRIADVLDKALERFAEFEAEANNQNNQPRQSMEPRKSFTYWAAASSGNIMQLLMDDVKDLDTDDE